MSLAKALRKLNFIQRQSDKVFADIKSGRYEKFCNQNQLHYYNETQNVHFPSLMGELTELAKEYKANICTEIIKLPDIVTENQNFPKFLLFQRGCYNYPKNCR